jgi:hypothetical protein
MLRARSEVWNTRGFCGTIRRGEPSRRRALTAKGRRGALSDSPLPTGLGPLNQSVCEHCWSWYCSALCSAWPSSCCFTGDVKRRAPQGMRGRPLWRGAQFRRLCAAEHSVTGVLDTFLLGAHTLRAHRTSTRDWGGQTLPRSRVEPARSRRRSGRLNRLRGEPSCGFIKSLRCLFGGSRKERGIGNS